MREFSSPFDDKVAIVTGGASGIGAALCEALARRGARVVVADVDAEGARQVAAALVAKGLQAHGEHVDVSQHDGVTKLVTDTAAHYGRLDYMFNNAAASATRGEVRHVGLPPWRRAMEVNLFGVVHGSLAASEQMIRQGFGHIVNIGSLAGLVAFPTSVPYGASKAAVANLSVGLRIEVADLGVKVSVVCPGPVHGKREKGWFKLMGTERAAELILKGVERNRAIIVFPFSARVLWWVYRICPNLLSRLGRKLVLSRRARQQVRTQQLGELGDDQTIQPKGPEQNLAGR